MAEYRLFEEGTVPVCTTAEWYAGRDSAPHLDQGLHRPRLELAAEHVASLLGQLGVSRVVDLGAGDGGLLSILPEMADRWGYDLQRSNVEASKARGVDVRYADVLRDPIDWAEVAVATEVIEHLVDPVGFLRLVGRRSAALVLSSPRTETPEAHYEHHLWAWDMAGYRALVERAGWRVGRHDGCGMFQVMTAMRGAV